MTKGQKVKYNFGKGKYHIGEYLGHSLNGHMIGILETTVIKAQVKPGKKYISIFYCQIEKLEVLS